LQNLELIKQRKKLQENKFEKEEEKRSGRPGTLRWVMLEGSGVYAMGIWMKEEICPQGQARLGLVNIHTFIVGMRRAFFSIQLQTQGPEPEGIVQRIMIFSVVRSQYKGIIQKTWRRCTMRVAPYIWRSA